ncbi:hypothetical protein QBE55_09405 [Eubacteriales bacterium mix99]|jgi:hypothetical protein
MRSFHGAGKCRSYFEGWYFKQQNGRDTVALIPAFHRDETGKPSASLQILTDTESVSLPFPAEAFSAERNRLKIRIGDCFFSEQGCRLDAKKDDFEIHGQLNYGPFRKPKYDMMGPFRFVPFMECRHSVFSLIHSVNGDLVINGKTILFRGGTGYAEGDRGTSFPGRYLWAQCCRGRESFMVSVADIPFFGNSFVGCLGFWYQDGKEHRIGTYAGARPLHMDEKKIVLRQGRVLLCIEALEARGQPLKAPQFGNMSRTIHESAACRVYFHASDRQRVLFDFESSQASFESNWEKSGTAQQKSP